MDGKRLDLFLDRVDQLLDRLDAWLPPAHRQIDWSATTAAAWQRDRRGHGHLEVVSHPHRLMLDDLHHLDRQKAALVANTERFLAGHLANNALLWGSRGTGKSSLVKALLHTYAARGLRLIEVDKFDLVDLPAICRELGSDARYRFIFFSDDLSFEANDPSYKALKAALDGSVNRLPDNVLVYATSNRRHLLPEFQSDNAGTRVADGELHHGEAVEEKISLSERFGLWLSFHPFKQDEYLTIVAHWLKQQGDCPLDEEARKQALRWALQRGSRSGRVAEQFAREYLGRLKK